MPFPPTSNIPACSSGGAECVLINVKDWALPSFGPFLVRGLLFNLPPDLFAPPRPPLELGELLGMLCLGPLLSVDKI
jgi:hypothetical protein